MQGLVLKAGGSLEFVAWGVDAQTGEERYLSSDVTADAVAYLMDAVRIEGGLHLRDIFALLERNPVLLQMFRRQYAAEYLTEASKKPAAPYTGEYDAEGIEYLELRPDWEKNAQTGELVVHHRLSIVGVGHVLRQDVGLNGGMLYSAGTRIQWSIMYCPLADLWNLPLQFNGNVPVVEDNSINTDGHGSALSSVVLAPSLAQVIHGVLWELSFGGGPEQTADLVDGLADAGADASAWTVRSVDELLRPAEARKD